MLRLRFFTNRSGGRIAYVDEGAGPLVVLPPWWVSHLELDAQDPAYARFFARLAASFRVVRYDRLGVGMSDRSRPSFTMESELDDLEALIDVVGGGPVHLLGFSCAGPVALAYAARHPERVRRLVLYGSYLCGASLSTDAVRTALIALVRANGRLGSRTLADIFHPGADADARRRFNELQRESAAPETAARLLELTYALDARPFVDQVRAPTLVLHRKEDVAIAHEQARALAASLPGATLTTLSGGAHFPWHGDADSLLDAVVAFLEDAPTAPAVDRPAQPAELRREGEMWRLRAGGRQSLLRHSKGLGDLARLVGRRDEDVHVLDLLGVDFDERRDAGRGELTHDRRSLLDARRRLDALDADLADAEARADLGRKTTLATERQALLDALAADLGLGGKARRLNDPIERARKAVHARLRDAIRRIKLADPELGDHLERSIHTGARCAYRPVPPMEWIVSPDPS